MSTAVEKRGSLERAIDPILALGWILWAGWESGAYTSAEMDSWTPDELADAIRKRCKSDADFDFCRTLASEWRGRRHESFTFSNIREELLPPDIPPQEVRYYAARSIRSRYRLRPSASIVRKIHELARRMRDVVRRYDTLKIPGNELRAALAGSQPPSALNGSPIGDAMLELFWVLDLLRTGPTPPEVLVRPEIANAEHLTSQLFGVSTRIPGFDMLFGGGLMLADPATTPSDSALPSEEAIGGRVIMTVGPFGSGKSTLALQVAADVARKGGVAWVIPFEQTYDECLYSMEAIGLCGQDRNFQVFRGERDAFLAFAEPAPPVGALVFYRPEQAAQNGYRGFLESIERRFAWLARYPLGLVVVDPLNALIDSDDLHGHDRDLRLATRRMFEAAKAANVNVWLTSEQAVSGAAATSFGENVADTVIHLGVEAKHGQHRRYIEVTKSRFQKASSGRNVIAIVPEGGIHVFPSSATISENLSTAWVPDAEFKIDFGIQGIDELLGPEPLRAGDTIAFAGPGKSKTLVGLEYLVSGAQDPAHSCLLVAGYDETRMKLNLDAAIHSKKLPENTRNNVVLCSISGMYAEPGQILVEIRNALEACLRKGRPVSRALVTNLSHWEQEVPAIRDDPMFGIALMNLIRSYGVVAVIVSGDDLQRGRRIHDIVFDQSDWLLHFLQRELKGRISTLVTAVKTRRMLHKREPFELTIDREGAAGFAPAPLFRSNAAGDVYAVSVRLFLNAETQNHKDYNNRMISAIKGTLSDDTLLIAQNVSYDPALLSMARYSALDELQILQLDEFQVPLPGDPPSALYHFDAHSHPGLLEGRDEALMARVRCQQDGRFFAVPFYQNLSFLAYNNEKLPSQQLPRTWEELAARCEAWDWDHSNSSEVFFSCPIYEDSFESYNCLFFEILYTLSPLNLEQQHHDLAVWLGSEQAIDAAYLFRRVCRRSHTLGYMAKRFPRAIFWRHWYNTLNQELSTFSPEERSGIRVQRLFGDITSAGEWYLAVPAHSASPDVGLYLIEQLTSAEREMHRLQLGIGLPTREAFYASEPGVPSDLAISPYFQFSRSELHHMVSKAIRRSSFRSYERFASSISSHLRWTLEIPPSTPLNGESYSFDGDKTLQKEIRRTMASLVSNIRFLSNSPGFRAQLTLDLQAGAEQISRSHPPPA